LIKDTKKYAMKFAEVKLAQGTNYYGTKN